jgi:hypothetical protein
MTESNPALPEPSDEGATPGAPQAPEPATTAVEVAEPKERVLLGLLASLLPILAGVAITVAIWRAGYIAAITSFLIALGAAFMYRLAAGRPARTGLAPLVLLIILGVVASFFAVVASDLWDIYDNAVEAGFEAQVSKATFIREGLTDQTILREYGKDMAMFALFAVLGIGGVIRSLFNQES